MVRLGNPGKAPGIGTTKRIPDDSSLMLPAACPNRGTNRCCVFRHPKAGRNTQQIDFILGLVDFEAKVPKPFVILYQDFFACH